MNTFLLKKGAPALALLGLALAGCQPDIEAPGIGKGSADFTKYIAVGNSLTAGYGDGGLYREGQLNSYPNILAEQFKAAGGGDFTQPLFSEAEANGSGYLRLTGFSSTGAPLTAQVTTQLAARTSTSPTAPYTNKVTTPVNNLGVPGIRLSDMQTPGYGSVAGNPFFERISSANPFQTYFQRVKADAATATFFTTWLGNNDVLAYSLAGGVGTTITPTDTFALKNTRLINVLTANGAKGVVATIPDVTTIPYFTTVRVADVKARFKAQSAALSLYVQATDANGVVAVREATDADLLTLTSQAVIGTGVGATPTNPLTNQFVLDANEQALVRAATTSYNNTLTTKANEKGLALFDANAFFRGIVTGFAINGTNNTAGFISGNLFSLDGVHPTPRGYAVIANEMISVINAKYGASLQTVNPNAYRAVIFP